MPAIGAPDFIETVARKFPYIRGAGLCERPACTKGPPRFGVQLGHCRSGRGRSVCSANANGEQRIGWFLLLNARIAPSINSSRPKGSCS